MARKKTPTARVDVKARISGRLRAIRLELFGDHGGPELARRLRLPARTWYNYESGVTVPAEVLLGFIDQTGADPLWLLNGEGPRYRSSSPPIDEPSPLAGRELTPEGLIRRSLQILAEQRRDDTDSDAPTSALQVSGHLAIAIIPLSHLCGHRLDPVVPVGQVSVDRRWVPHVASTIATRLEDEAMTPILPERSIVAIDRSPADPLALSGRIVAACINGKAMIRWLEVSGHHIILRPNLPAREHPLVPIDLSVGARDWFLGSVVWSWSRFGPMADS
jgi:hypothetical protein